MDYLPRWKKVYLQTQKIPFEYNHDEIGVLGISRDITELHLTQKKIIALSYIDELTQAFNRKSYNERINEFLSFYRRYHSIFSILLYDIDDFKKINDTYGHSVGDKVLIEMTSSIQSHIRQNDYLFRVGGEEFVLLFPKTSLAEALKVAQKIKDAVEQLKTIPDYTITISIGLTEVKPNDTPDTIFQRADNLLYLSKRTGKNRISTHLESPTIALKKS